jgi:hypothetical protein
MAKKWTKGWASRLAYLYEQVRYKDSQKKEKDRMPANLYHNAYHKGKTCHDPILEKKKQNHFEDDLFEI